MAIHKKNIRTVIIILNISQKPLFYLKWHLTVSYLCKRRKTTIFFGEIAGKLNNKNLLFFFTKCKIPQCHQTRVMDDFSTSRFIPLNGPAVCCCVYDGLSWGTAWLCFGACTSDRLSKYIPSLSHDKQLLATENNSSLPLLTLSNNIPIQVSHLQAVSALSPFHLSIIALTHEKYIK